MKTILSFIETNFPELKMTMYDLLTIKYWYDYNQSQIPQNQIDYLVIFELMEKTK